MLNRRWLYYAAFGVALTLAFPALGQDAVQPADRPSQEEEAGDSGENQQQAEENTEPGEPANIAGPIFIAGDTITQWIMAIAGVAAILVSVWAVWLLWKTLQATRVMITEAKNTTVAAKRAVAVAREALDETRVSAERQLRAYVFPAGALVTLNEDGTATTEVPFRNTGQTPAHNVRCWTNIAAAPLSMQNNLPTFPAPSEQVSVGVVASGREGTVTVDLNTPVGEHERNEIASARAGNIRLWHH